MTLPKRWWLLVLPLLAACDSGRQPAAPTLPALTTISITGTDLILVGDSDTFTATSNTGASVTGFWGSDAPTVATVESYTGRVTAVGTGTATIFVDSNGIRGTKLIRTLPNVSGVWSGQYEETGCEASGDFVLLQICPSSEYDFAIGSMTIRLAQNRDAVSGEFRILGYRATDLSGAVAADGTLTFSGRALDARFSLELQNVRFQLSQTNQMTGSFEQLYSSRTSAPAGTWRVFAQLRRMAR